MDRRKISDKFKEFFINSDARWSSGCVLDCHSEWSEVQTPARVEIWIQISAPCAVVHPYSASWTTSQWLPEPVYGLEHDYGEEESVERKGAELQIFRP